MLRSVLAALFLIPGAALSGAGVAEGQQPVAVGDALVDRDGDRVPDRLGDTVAVEGLVISTPVVLGRDASLVNFQDRTGGIVLFARDTARLRSLVRGDSIRVRGRIGQYLGAEQLLVLDIDPLGRTAVPAPEDVLVTDLLGEEYFGRLVRVAGTLTARETDAGWVDVTLEDRTGAIPVYISGRWLTNPWFVERLIRGGDAVLTGVASQETGADPPTVGYRLVPRDTDDFALPAPPPYGLILGALLVVLGAALLWWHRRERRRTRELRRLTDELRESQDELRAREERFRSLVENAADTMSILGPEGRVHYQSPSVRRMLGWEAAELEGRNSLELIHPDDRDAVAAELAELSASPGESTEVEFRIRAKDGSWHRVEVTGTNRLHDPAVQGIVCNTRDVTQHKALEQLVRDADRIEAIGRLAGGVAHDFNNVLTALRGHAELAIDALGADGDPRSELEEIVRGTDRAAALTQQLLAFSRQRVTQPRVIPPGEIVGGMLPMLRRLIGEDIELDATVAPDTGRVRIDPVQLEQVVMNLAVNARDAMPDGGRMTLELTDDRITESQAARYPYQVVAGPYVRLTVADTGEGMDDEILSHVFDPFFTTKDQGQGTGLGLATLFGIVKQAGGYVWAHSEPGAGSRFDVFLPRVEAGAGATRPTTDGAAPRRRGRGETILLVEDEAPVRKLARRVLEKNGYRILEAEDPATALALVERHSGPIDLLFTDVVMPGMSGGELAERLRASRPDLPTLFTSGYTEDEVVRRGVSAGEAAFMEKPFTPDELLRQIRKVLDGRPVVR
ncbi:MAG: PAS domain S-box protein [Longimicrobiales bacterium]|nr:PAS domain S-box protein [Longimicrobiales bacterium]